MRVSPTLQRLSALLAGILIAALTACYLPIHALEPASPALVGRYMHSDGTPAAGAAISLVVDDPNAPCSEARVHAVADSEGTFHLAATTLRRDWVMIIPPMERFFNHYALCLSASDSVSHRGYAGMVPIRTRDAVHSDSLSCLEWFWEDQVRVTCAGSARERALQSGGRWADGTGSGFYRLIVVDPADEGPEPRVVLQWVERETAGDVETVRSAIALPLAPKLLAIEEARLWLPSGRPACVSVRSVGRPPRLWSWGPARQEIAYELGPPGKRSEVKGCALAAREPPAT